MKNIISFLQVFFIVLFVYLPTRVWAEQADSTSYLVTRFGAVGDGHILNTISIQRAIDSCSAKGGGLVVIPAGNFLTATLYIKSGVTLDIQEGAVLMGSSHRSDYPLNSTKYKPGKFMALIVAEDAQHIGIKGSGTIDGQGGSPDFGKESAGNMRPLIILFIHCQYIGLSDIHLINSASWVQYYFYCQHLRLTNISVYSYANYFNDGLDIDAEDAIVSGCNISSEDDGICLKSAAPVPCKNVRISNCTISTDCNGIKMGTGSANGFQDIDIRNCIVKRPPVSPFYHFQQLYTGITDSLSAISGLALEVVEGGVMDNVHIDGIQMSGVQTPLFIKLGDRSRWNPDSAHVPGIIRNIAISHISAVNVSGMTSSITGFPGYYVQNVRLSDISFMSPGGGNGADTSRGIPEKQTEYPENAMFGPSLPAYGLYIRHAKQIILQNVKLGFMAPDVRPALWMEDVEGMMATGLQMKPPSNGKHYARIVQSSGIRLPRE